MHFFALKINIFDEIYSFFLFLNKKIKSIVVCVCWSIFVSYFSYQFTNIRENKSRGERERDRERRRTVDFVTESFNKDSFSASVIYLRNFIFIHQNLIHIYIFAHLRQLVSSTSKPRFSPFVSHIVKLVKQYVFQGHTRMILSSKVSR